MAPVVLEFYWASKTHLDEGRVMWAMLCKELDRLEDLYLKGKP